MAIRNLLYCKNGTYMLIYLFMSRHPERTYSERPVIQLFNKICHMYIKTNYCLKRVEENTIFLNIVI